MKSDPLVTLASGWPRAPRNSLRSEHWQFQNAYLDICMQQEKNTSLDFAAPWEAFPDVPRFAAGWRTSNAEKHMLQWHDMYARLDTWERRHYRRTHRRPLPLWLGFYAMCSSKHWYRTAGIALTVFVYFVLFFARILVGPFAADRIKLD